MGQRREQNGRGLLMECGSEERAKKWEFQFKESLSAF
jgi:hypothetical protein